jgi:hypothetical protein
MRRILTIVLVFAMIPAARAQQQPTITLPEITVEAKRPTASAQQSTFRDSSGRTTGTAATSGNQTTYRDDRGRTTGTATTDSQGTTTFRDSSGRTVGTATAPRRW